jgi:hypothetical protein
MSDSLPSSKVLDKLYEEYAARARKQPTPPSLDPNEINTRAEAALDQFRDAAADGTPELLLFRGNKALRWTDVIAFTVARSRAEVAKPGHAAVQEVVAASDRIEPAVLHAEGVRRRVVQAIEGNRSEPERADALRAAVLGDRKPPSSKAAWENEVRTTAGAIRSMKDAPEALLALLPRLDAAAEQLSNARPMPAGKPRLPDWSPGVVEASMVLLLVLGDALSWAAAWATDKRNGAFQRAIAPKRRGDSGRVVTPPNGATEAAPPASPAAVEQRAN